MTRRLRASSKGRPGGTRPSTAEAQYDRRADAVACGLVAKSECVARTVEEARNVAGVVDSQSEPDRTGVPQRLSPGEFIAKWRASTLKENSASQEHFIDLCRLLGERTPAEAAPTGETCCFERGARKDTGGHGWSHVWKLHCFAWEYEAKLANLDAAFNQLRQYGLAVENPPLLIVSETVRFRIAANWTDSVSEQHEFVLDEFADAAVRDKLRRAMSDPERLRPGESLQGLTTFAAETLAELAHPSRRRRSARGAAVARLRAERVLPHLPRAPPLARLSEAFGWLPPRRAGRASRGAGWRA